MLKDELKALLAPVIEDLGYCLWGLEYFAQGKHSTLRIYIDREDGIGIEDCERVSRQVSALLDVEDPIAGNYQLEISSPGMPKPLFYGWQYAQYKGQEVSIKLMKPVSGLRNIKGIIESVSEDGLVIHTDEQSLEILFPNILKANLTV